MVTARPPRNDPVEEDEELNDDNSINVFVPTPTSGKRRKRFDGEESDMSDNAKIVTPNPKKRKILPVRAKDDEDERLSSTRPVVELPAKIPTPQKQSSSTVEGQLSSTKTKHRRFDSEEPAEEFFSTAPEPNGEEDGDNEQSAGEQDEESDDDAPEAIRLQEAVQTIKSMEKEAAKAVKEQQTATRQRRKERDEALRKQSESAKKRKPKTKRKAEEGAKFESNGREQETDEAGINKEGDKMPSTSFGTRQNLPDLLPLEFLEDDDPSEIVPIEEQPEKLPSKKKFKDLLEKKPKDRRIGGTTYRVTKTQSTSLAPKAVYNARSVKESWLQGRSRQRIEPNRKPFSKASFNVKKRERSRENRS